MLIDLHNHTRRHSSCSRLAPEELVRLAVDAGLDAIAITEHDSYFEPDLAAALEHKFENKIRIFVGMEATVIESHVLVFGERIPEGPYGSLDELLAHTRQQETATVLAHPLRWGGLDRFDNEGEIAAFFGLFDAVEVKSANLSRREQDAGLALCRRLQCPMAAGSDAHSPEMAARYATEFDVPIMNDSDLVRALRGGRFRPRAL